MLSCIWNCIKAIPWWAWLILAVVAVVIAILSYFTGGIAALSLPLWLEAALVGLGSTVGLTLLYCIQGCLRTG
jgi:hypothetical protein